MVKTQMDYLISDTLLIVGYMTNGRNFWEQKGDHEYVRAYLSRFYTN